MNLINNLVYNARTMTGCTALDFGFRQKYTYEHLLEYLRYYSYHLQEYKNKGIDRIGIIVKDNINFDTLVLVLSLIGHNITPIIINESIGEQIKGIIEKDDIKIVFYESLKKPSYLKKYDVVIDEEPQYFVGVKPYSNVSNIFKIDSLNWYLTFLKSKKAMEPCICSMYDKVKDNIENEIVTESDIIDFCKKMDGLEFNGKWQIGLNTLPLYKKLGFLFLSRALTNDMNIICSNESEIEKNINKLLKYKPVIATIDKYMIFEINNNPKYENIDLSFLKKVIIDIEPEYKPLVYNILETHGFVGEYINDELFETEKIMKLK